MKKLFLILMAIALSGCTMIRVKSGDDRIIYINFHRQWDLSYDDLKMSAGNAPVDPAIKEILPKVVAAALKAYIGGGK